MQIKEEPRHASVRATQFNAVIGPPSPNGPVDLLPLFRLLTLSVPSPTPVRLSSCSSTISLRLAHNQRRNNPVAPRAARATAGSLDAGTLGAFDKRHDRYNHLM